MPILYPPKRKYTSSLRTHETFINIDRILAHKGNLNKFLKAESVQALFSDDDMMRQKIKSQSSNQHIQTL